jgi:hypothetical protein
MLFLQVLSSVGRTPCALKDLGSCGREATTSFASAWNCWAQIGGRPEQPFRLQSVNGTRIVDSQEAAQFLDFACSSYGLLLRWLVQCFGRPPKRAEAADNGSDEMMTLLARHLRCLPVFPLHGATPF